MLLYLVVAAVVLSSPALRAAEAIPSPKAPLTPFIKSEFSMADSGCGGEGNLADVQCLVKYLGWLDRELNQAYKLALEKLPEKDNFDNRGGRGQLRKSQRAWLKYKADNCPLVGAMEGGSNLWKTHFGALCEEREIKERIRFLKEIVGNE